MGEQDVSWKERLVGFDFEVTSHDWLLVIRKYPTNEVLGVFHNDNEGVEDFLNEHDYIYVGYNNKDYDNYILKGILNNYSPEDIKKINDFIIVEHKKGWEYNYDKPFIKLPPTCDLILDLPLRQSLKEIEGNMCMDIRESTVDFNIDHPWTKEEFDEMLFYCKHDVFSTVKLIDERMDYLEAKVLLGEMCGVEPEIALYKTNAQMCAESLGAEKVERNDEKEYVYPKQVNFELLPAGMIDFFERFKVSDNAKGMSFTVDIGGVEHTIALGGIHGAEPNYIGESNDDYVILMSDIASYYPALMILYNYLSRNVKDKNIYIGYKKDRMIFKRTDKKKANALKLPLNTTFGAMLNEYNKLYDPLMGRSVCITGQLLITNLLYMLLNNGGDFKLIQSNTDGIAYRIPRKQYDECISIINEWCGITGFDMEHTIIEKIIQKDVNNYCMSYYEDNELKYKVKGGYVSDYKPNFAHNSFSIVAKAIVKYFMENVSIEETINACDDPFQFQLIAKTGSTYSKTLYYVNGEEIEVQKTNRLYAVKDGSLGVVKKYKKIYLELDEDGERRYYINLKGKRTYKKNWETDEQGDFFVKKDTTQNCPPHAFIDNSCQITIDTIDKSWYIELAKKRINDFLGVKPEKKEKKKMAAKKEVEPVQEVVVEPRVALLQKIFKVGEILYSAPWIMDGYNSHQSYEYITSHKYREELGKACRQVGLIFKMNIGNRDFKTLEGSKMNLTTVVGTMCFIDPDTGEHEDYMVMGDGADNLDKGIFKAETMMIKYFVLNNFLLPKQKDELDPENGEDEKKVDKEKSKAKSPVNIVKDEKPKTMPATPQQREDAKTSVVEDNFATESTINEMISIMDKIREVKEGYGEKTYIKLQSALEGNEKLPKVEAVKMMSKFEERMDELGIE